MINVYLKDNKDTFSQLSVLLYNIVHSNATPIEVLAVAEEFLTGAGEYDKFQDFIHKLSEVDDTWKFWKHFVFQYCLAYIGLFLSVQCRKWKLKSS